MSNIIRLIHQALPEAKFLLIEAKESETKRITVQAHSIHGSEADLWRRSATSPSESPLRLTDDGYTWEEVIAEVESELDDILGQSHPEHLWKPANSESNDSYCINLHEPKYSAAIGTMPGHLVAQLRNSDSPNNELWIAEPVESPTMTVGGVHIVSHLSKEDGTLIIDVRTKDLAPANGTGKVSIEIKRDGVSVSPSPKSTPTS